jgi:hypothetical protein
MNKAEGYEVPLTADGKPFQHVLKGFVKAGDVNIAVSIMIN